MAFVECNFFADTLGFATQVNVILPEAPKRLIGMDGKSHDAPPSVLYLLHGLSDDHTIWMRRTSIERYAAAHGIAVVMPNGGRSFYRNVTPFMRYWDFLSEELPQKMHSFFRLADDREHTFAAGLSMGGFGALKLGLNHPERFAAIAALSGAFGFEWFRGAGAEFDFAVGSPEKLQGTEDDLPFQAEKCVKSSQKLPLIYQSCGTEDSFFEINCQYHAMLTDLGFSVDWRPRPGKHTWDFWDEEIQKVLDFLPIPEK
ncbi:MAG: esterase family protein [Victivallaceae bacterium]|nr:esterase family protein [Victivallaceae bacterium]